MESFLARVSARFRTRCGFHDARTQIERGLWEEKMRIPSGLSTRLISCKVRRRDSSGTTQSIPLKAITTASKDVEVNFDKSAASNTLNSSCGNFFRQLAIISLAQSTPTYRDA